MIRDNTHPRCACPQYDALVESIHQLESLLDGLSDEHYARKPIGRFQGSIGGHVRHSIDHMRTLLNVDASGLLNYDERERGTDIEHNRPSAVAALRELEARFLNLPSAMMERRLTLRAMLTSDGVVVEAETSFARELAFVLSHTIHHNAILAAMLREIDFAPPPDFGYAPSTVAYLSETSCARSHSFHS